MLSCLYFVVHSLFNISHSIQAESGKWFQWSVPLSLKKRRQSDWSKASEREVEFIRKICMKRRFNNFSTNLEAWSTQRQMGEWRRGGRGQSDDREVLDGVISETRAVRRAVSLTISHKGRSPHQHGRAQMKLNSFGHLSLFLSEVGKQWSM